MEPNKSKQVFEKPVALQILELCMMEYMPSKATEAYSKPYQTYNMKRFAKIV